MHLQGIFQVLYLRYRCTYRRAVFRNGKIAPIFCIVFVNFCHFSLLFYSFLKTQLLCFAALKYVFTYIPYKTYFCDNPEQKIFKELDSVVMLFRGLTVSLSSQTNQKILVCVCNDRKIHRKILSTLRKISFLCNMGRKSGLSKSFQELFKDFKESGYFPNPFLLRSLH